MQIHVTWKDVFSGKPMRTTECMVALALKRELGIEYASVGLEDVAMKLNGRDLKLRLPKKVSRQIRLWERFHFVFPFSFDFAGLTFAEAVASGDGQPSFGVVGDRKERYRAVRGGAPVGEMCSAGA